MYTMVVTRHDLSHVVGVVSRYMSNPGWKHWEVIKHILRYLRGTKDARLTFGSVKGYTDFHYAGNTDNRKSTSGYVFTYGCSAISWRSKLQECTALSITKAEYIARSDAAKEAVWLHSTISWLLDEKTTWLTIYCDSQSAIHLIWNLVYHVKTKDIEVRSHHIRELVTGKKIRSPKDWHRGEHRWLLDETTTGTTH